MKNILLIDINRRFRSQLGLRLTEQGYGVREAHGGRNGISAYCKHPADAVVVELFLPEVDGLEIIMTLKRLSPTMPIIAVAEPTVFTNVLGMASKLGATGSILKDNSSDVESICHLLNLQLSVFSEKRLFPRFQARMSGRLIPAQQNSESMGTDCQITDISVGGVGLGLSEADAQAVLGKHTDFLLELKTGDNTETVLYCTSRRAYRQCERLMLGMEFTRLSVDNLLSLKGFLL